jgi:hypothetical protein
VEFSGYFGAEEKENYSRADLVENLPVKLIAIEDAGSGPGKLHPARYRGQKPLERLPDRD